MEIEQLYGIYLEHPEVQTDTRKLKEGDLFFALKGPSFDGNRFASQAIEKGAAYAVIDDASYAINGKTLIVDDVLRALQQLALYHRQQFSIPFLAITGSNGKTTTKELIHAVLSRKYKTYTTEGNLNNHIGVPLTLLKMRRDAEMAIIEMGANHQREIASYCTIALPTHGLITNCGKAHLEGFGGVEGVRKGKGELYDHLRACGGTAFVMWDYDYLREMSKGISTIRTYGTRDAEIIGNVSASDPFLNVDFSRGFDGQIHTKLVGDYNLPNVLAAVAAGVYFSVPADSVRSAIEEYEPTNSRSQMIQKGKRQIILDAYNANPSSMKAAIDNFAHSSARNKILVLGSMAELGPESAAEHRALVAEIRRHEWKDVLLVGDQFRDTDHPFRQFNSADEAGSWLRSQETEDAALLIKGSRSMQMEKVMNYL